MWLRGHSLAADIKAFKISDLIYASEAMENRQTQAQFQCVNCGYENHADVVGAINILERGHRLLACGENVWLDISVKQEPTEVTPLSN